MSCRVGQGFDVHEFEPGKPLRLGGLTIPSDVGLRGHSDADVVLHALCDALLGAAGLGDMGEHFPDTDPQFKDRDSQQFLYAVLAKLSDQSLSIVNADITLIAQKPRLGPYKTQIKQHIASLINIDASKVNVKATTTEGLGFVGREEGVAAMAIVMLKENLPSVA